MLFNDRGPVGVLEHSKRSFNPFRKHKARADPTPPAPPPPPPRELTPPLPVNAPPPTTAKETPLQKRIAKKKSTDIDEELRRHMEREGFAFLNFTDPVETLSLEKKPADPVEASRRDGTLLKDAVELMEKKLSMDVARPTEKLADIPISKPVMPGGKYGFLPDSALQIQPSHMQHDQSQPRQKSPPPASLDRAVSPARHMDQQRTSSPAEQRASPSALQHQQASPPIQQKQTPPPPNQKQQKPPHQHSMLTKRKPNVSIPQPSLVDSTPRHFTVPMESMVVTTEATSAGSYSGQYQMNGSWNPSQRQPNGHRVPVQQQHQINGHRKGGREAYFSEGSNESLANQSIESEKSKTDSGKDMGMDMPAGKGFATNGRPESPVEASSPVKVSSAMARFSQEASMQEVDPRWNNRNSGSHGQQMRPRQGPAQDKKRKSANGPEYLPSGHTQPENRGSPRDAPRGQNRGLRDSTNQDVDRALYAKSHAVDDRRTSDSTLSLPVPVMLPPDGYTCSLNMVQQTCAISHLKTVLSYNIHHRISCMICQTDAPNERWTCGHCALRFCTRCKAELVEGRSVDQILVLAETEEWQIQLGSPISSPIRGGPERNISWEIASMLEAGGRLRWPSRVQTPSQGRRPPPPNRKPSPDQSGNSSPQSISPVRTPVPAIHTQPPSPTSDKRDSTGSSVKGYSDSNRSQRSSGHVEAAFATSDKETMRRVFQNNKEAKRKTVQRIMKDEGRSQQPSGRCTPQNIGGVIPAGTSASDQRKALLGGGIC